MSTAQKPVQVHVVAGGFTRGSSAGHDIDYARLRILQLLQEGDRAVASVSGDCKDVASWLPKCELLVTYVAGPYPNDDENGCLNDWLEDGGRWLALHGTSGGKAARVDGQRRRRMVKTSHHQTLGSFFINHPPVRRFRVNVASTQHPVVRGLEATFEVEDELYLIELLNRSETEILLTTELDRDPSPPGFGFLYDEDTALEPDGHTRVLGYSLKRGQGEVVYIALGHCHDAASNVQPFVDDTLGTGGATPKLFRGPWETDAFRSLLRNGLDWAARSEEAS